MNKLTEAIKRAEAEHGARVVTMDNGEPGGWCRCCGGDPKLEPTWRDEPWFVYRSSIVDEDGVFYSMLCEGCLEEMRAVYAERIRRHVGGHEVAKVAHDLLGDDLDGVQVTVEDWLESQEVEEC